MTTLDRLLDKIAAMSAKTIQEAAERSFEADTAPETGPMGSRTDLMNKRNRDYRRRLGDLDP